MIAINDCITASTDQIAEIICNLRKLSEYVHKHTKPDAAHYTTYTPTVPAVSYAQPPQPPAPVRTFPSYDAPEPTDYVPRTFPNSQYVYNKQTMQIELPGYNEFKANNFIPNNHNNHAPNLH